MPFCNGRLLRFRDDSAELLEDLGGVSVIDFELSPVPADQAERWGRLGPFMSNSRTSKQDRPSDAK